MYDFALAFAEGNAIMAIIYLMAITLGMMGLAAYHQNTLTSWSRSSFFWLSTLWSIMVLLDVMGVISLSGSSLPQIALK